MPLRTGSGVGVGVLGSLVVSLSGSRVVEESVGCWVRGSGEGTAVSVTAMVGMGVAVFVGMEGAVETAVGISAAISIPPPQLTKTKRTNRPMIYFDVCMCHCQWSIVNGQLSMNAR